jgi:glycosyltransferase involved in cell wall biosynthesis
MECQHTFAICAYKESPYLEECVQSVLKQNQSSKVIMVTSTPNDYIQKICEQYNIPLFVNEGESGIVQDWNFAYKMSSTKYVTIAHQDDIYLPEYSEKVVQGLEESKHPLIAFTDYSELRNGEEVLCNRNLQIKRWMLSLLRIKALHKSRFVRRRILSFGCPICCPSVAFAKENLPEEVFEKGFRSDEDWQAWEKLSKYKGSFVYVDKVEMCHRIHEESETSIIIGDNARSEEDFQMFCKFWPRPIAKILTKIYSSSETSNEL